MYAREVTVQGANDPAKAVELIDSTILPGLSPLSGFKGLSLSGDPESGTAWFVSNWATVEDLIASREGSEEVRKEGAAKGGVVVTRVREWVSPSYEVSASAPTAGLPVNLNQHLYNPTLIEEVVGYFLWVAEPLYQSSPGFRSVQMLVDRTTGEVQVISSWDDTQSLEQGFERLGASRDRAVAKGMKFADRSQRELIFFSY